MLDFLRRVLVCGRKDCLFYEADPTGKFRVHRERSARKYMDYTTHISVIIVNWNGLRFLKDCLTSVFRQDYPLLEVIFVDNGSTDGSLEFVKREFPRAIVVENKENLGFAAGNNRGIEVSKGEYVMTLNNDAALAPDTVRMLVTAAEISQARVGMWAPKILSIEDPGMIDSAGGLLIYPDCLAKGRGRLERDSGQYDRHEEVFIPSACAALYRREMLNEVGLFDEDFFAYCEDTDLGLRARLSGWATLSVPIAVVYHHYSGTGGRYTPLKAYLVERNRIWVAIKNLPLRYLAVSPLYTLWRYILQVYGLVRGRGAGSRFAGEFSSRKLFFILLRSYFDAFRKLPSMISKRRRVQRRRSVPVKEYEVWSGKFGVSASKLALKD